VIPAFCPFVRWTGSGAESGELRCRLTMLGSEDVGSLGTPRLPAGPAQVKRDRRRRVPTTPEMCFLASRLEAGAVTAAELKLAAKLVMALVDRLPPRVDAWKHGRRYSSLR